MEFGMNLLLWTDTVTEKTFPLLAQIKEIGFDLVELPLFDSDVSMMTKVGKELDRLGLARTSVTVVSESENIISPDAAVRRHGIEARKKTLDAAAAAGCKMLIGPLHSAIGCFSGRGSTADEWKHGVESMRKIAEYAQKVKVRLGIEALNRFECYFLNAAEDLARYIDDVNHPYCRAMYDTFHAHIEEKDPKKAITDLGDRIALVHISENDRSTPGKGQVAWRKTFDTLAAIQYDGPMVVEAFGNQLEKITAATKIWRPMFRSQTTLAKTALAFMKREVAKRWN